MNTLEEANERIAELEQQLADQTARADNHWHTLCDKDYMIGALVNMLGPNGMKVWRSWRDKGILRVHYDWGPAAWELDGEGRAERILEMDRAMEDAVRIDNVDEHFEEILK